MASRSGRQGHISPETKELMKINGTDLDDIVNVDGESVVGPRKSPPERVMHTSLPETTSEEGCRVCQRDEDHANLLLCEACNDEYHTYCLNPPLQSVPDDDWFCDKCRQFHSVKDDDGLDFLVSALPPPYTSRFGEIVWAAGGQGFGWWPACIYDPRLTVGGARQLARKNLGKRHLVYFFECIDAPFTVLADNRLTKWEDGFLEEYDLGKTAKSGNKGKSALFDRALHLARMENDRPIEIRMDWNHQGTQTQLKIPKSRSSSSINSPVVHSLEIQPTKKKPKTANTNDSSLIKVEITQQLTRVSSVSSVVAATGNQPTNKVNRRNMNSILASFSKHETANAIESLEDGPLVCKILLKLPHKFDSSSKVEGLEFSHNVGFISLPSRQNATFCCIRKAMESDLDDDCFTVGKGKHDNGGPRWKFHVPKLGPVSIKQEVTLGPVLEFLKSVTNDVLLGNGTPSSPLKIIIMGH